jgi:hypothetical protein
MKYITFQENNKKEYESFIFFLQYDGNEEHLKLLNNYINYADFSSLYGDYSTFEIDIDTLLDEETVENICKVRLGSFSKRFQICKGHFDLPYEVFINSNETETARILDDLFFACQIRDHFILEGENKENIIRYESPFINMIKQYREYVEKLSDKNYKPFHSELNNIIKNMLNFSDVLSDVEKTIVIMCLYKLFILPVFKPYFFDNKSFFDVMVKKAKDFLENCDEKLTLDKDNKTYTELKEVLLKFLEISKKI